MLHQRDIIKIVIADVRRMESEISCAVLKLEQGGKAKKEYDELECFKLTSEILIAPFYLTLEAMEKLNSELFEVWHLYYLKNYTVRKISCEIGYSDRTVSRRLKKAESLFLKMLNSTCRNWGIGELV